jgi:hypothetical protein
MFSIIQELEELKNAQQKEVLAWQLEVGAL